MITTILYLTIVVVTTPSQRPVDAVKVSVTLNWWLIGGISGGAGVQAFLLGYAKNKPCPVRHTGTILGTSGFFSGLSSFLSFLSLIPLGCCGTWIYVISFLPGLIGAGASGFLVANSLQIEVAGLVLMALSVMYTYLSVRKKPSSLRGLDGSGPVQQEGSLRALQQSSSPSRSAGLALFREALCGPRPNPARLVLRLWPSR